MDGLTISNVDRTLPNSTETTRVERPLRSELNPGGINDSQDGSFASTLKSAIHSVDKLQKTADVQMQKLSTGQSQNLHETMIASEKADIALKLMVQVRNKMIDAYHEIMKMQV